MRLIAACLMFVGTAAAADPPPGWSYAVTYKGKPVAGATVGLTVYTYPTPGDPKPTGDPVFATSDAAGEVRFPTTTAGVTYARFLARDSAGRGGYGGIYATGGQKHPPTLDLSDPRELTGRVSDAAGKPVPGLTLKPVALGPENFGRFGNRPVTLTDTPDWFWEAFPTKVAADGGFTLTGVPVGHSVAVHFAAPGYGSGRFWVVPGQATVVTLARTGAVRLRFTPAAGAKPGDVTVRTTRTATPTDNFIEVTATRTAKAGGELTLPDLPPGTYQIDFPYTGPAAVFPKSVPPLVVKSGETTDVTTPMEPAARVTAKLVDSKTGAGVPGAGLSVNVSRGSETVYAPGAKSDAGGKVDVFVPAGMVSVSPTPAPGYAVVKFSGNRFNQSSTEALPVAPGKAHDFGTFALVRTVDLAGTVVDAAGNPVAGAAVKVGYSGTNDYSGKPIVSTADGTFVVPGLNPDGGVVGLTARKGRAITAAPVAVDPGKPSGELRVIVSESFEARARVRAVDRAGRPVAAAGVELARSVTYLAMTGGVIGGGSALKVGATTDDGRFESDILQPGDQYGITLSAPGYRGATTEKWVAKPGEVRDYGDLVLTRADVAVTGTVTDLAGRPVAGATVFSNADGPRPTEATSDAAGRFTLGGLYEGPAFVSAKADGFRLTSVPVEAGGPAVRVVLPRQSDPPAPPPVIADSHKEATAKLTRHLLDSLWANRVAANDDGKLIVRAMARLAPDTARKWRDEEKARSEGKNDLTSEIEAVVRERALFPTAKEDPDEAIALLKPLGGAEGFRAVCALTERLLPGSPDTALRVAEEAVVRARGLGESKKAWALAQAGELVYRAGRKDAGRTLIAEAAAAADKLGYDGLDGYSRGMAAGRVALYDPVKARAMIDPIKDGMEFNRYLALACVRCAGVDLPRAKAWLADFRPGGSLSPLSARQLMAFRLARTAPDEAAALAESIDNPTYRALALAGVAARVSDKKRAVKLIDAAVDGVVASPTGHFSNNGGGGGTAALAMYRARQIGHPDLAGVRDKVLAGRSNPGDHPFRQASEAGVRVALALALTDPETARTILDRAVPPGERTRIQGMQNRDVLIALALADPAGATSTVDAVLARAVAAKQGFKYTGLDYLATLLTEPDRLYENAVRSGSLVGESEEE